MSTTEPPGPAFDQIVKGNVTIKKLSSHRYRITFSKIGKFLVYQVWDKDNAGNLNSNRSVVYLSVKEWVENFNNLNKRLEEKNKPLFTPTTIMETEDYECFAFVLDKANVNSFGRVVFTVSTKQIKLESNNTSSKNLIKIPCGKFNNVRFDIDAPDRKLPNVVYNVSDCGFPNVRSYCCGGAGPASACGRWVIDEWLNIIWKATPYPTNDFEGESPPHNYNWMDWDFWGGYTFL